MKILLVILAGLLILLVGLYVYLGGLRKVNASVRYEGGDLLFYVDIKGDYKQSATVMDKVYYALLNDYQIETTKGFGIYYDDPQTTAKEELRSEAGCILEEEHSEHYDDISNRFKMTSFPEDRYILAEFPYKTKASVMMSVFKVYPALNKYAKLKGWCIDTPVMEIYDLPNHKILYRKEIRKLNKKGNDH